MSEILDLSAQLKAAKANRSQKNKDASEAFKAQMAARRIADEASQAVQALIDLIPAEKMKQLQRQLRHEERSLAKNPNYSWAPGQIAELKSEIERVKIKLREQQAMEALQTALIED